MDLVELDWDILLDTERGPLLALREVGGSRVCTFIVHKKKVPDLRAIRRKYNMESSIYGVYLRTIFTLKFKVNKIFISHEEKGAYVAIIEIENSDERLITVKMEPADAFILAKTMNFPFYVNIELIGIDPAFEATREKVVKEDYERLKKAVNPNSWTVDGNEKIKN